MHKPYFSIIRDFILSESKSVLQDDSGIPFKFLNEGKWDLTIYGSYTVPIPMFKPFYQDDLKKAVSDSSKVKKLPFGIGYNWRLGQSNLLVAKKKATE